MFWFFCSVYCDEMRLLRDENFYWLFFLLVSRVLRFILVFGFFKGEFGGEGKRGL